LAYAGMLLLTWHGFNDLPSGYIPSQDKGYLLVSVQLPDAASLERTIAVVEKGDQIVRRTPGVAHSVAISGQSFVLGAYGSNFGQFFIILDEFHQRSDPQHYREEFAKLLREQLPVAAERERIRDDLADSDLRERLAGPVPEGELDEVIEEILDRGLDSRYLYSERIAARLRKEI